MQNERSNFSGRVNDFCKAINQSTKSGIGLTLELLFVRAQGYISYRSSLRATLLYLPHVYYKLFVLVSETSIRNSFYLTQPFDFLMYHFVRTFLTHFHYILQPNSSDLYLWGHGFCQWKHVFHQKNEVNSSLYYLHHLLRI